MARAEAPPVESYSRPDSVVLLRPRTHKASIVGTNAKNKFDTTLNISLQADRSLLCVKWLDPGSGRQILAIWHGAGANPGVFIPEI